MSELSDPKDSLWKVADKLRGRMNPTEYRPLILGLIFLRAISEGGFDRHDDSQAAARLDVPEAASWGQIRALEKDVRLAVSIDGAMEALEAANPRLKGTLPTGYGKAGLSTSILSELIELLSTVAIRSEGSSRHDVLGRVYEYFLGRFAATAGRGDGEFYTPPSVVELLVEMIEPLSGDVYDPCSGSGGMFVQAKRFIDAHGSSPDDLRIFGQEMNPSTWKLARLNLAAHGLDADLGGRPADSFSDDLHPKLSADYVLANPPFNISDWGGADLVRDQRWQWGVPPATNANYAWIQHITTKLADGGVAGVVLANGSLSSNQADELRIRRALVEANLVDCIVALPGKLFYTTGIPACLWFIRKDRSAPGSDPSQREDTLFIDARQMGHMVSRVHRELAHDDISLVAITYREWRARVGLFSDVPGFVASVGASTIAGKGYTLVPARYVGAAEDSSDVLDSEEIAQLLRQELAANAKISQEICEALDAYAS